MAQPKDWLGPFIENEVRAVIAWKHTLEKTSFASVAPDDRFSDDGSNFRSVITSSMLPPDAKVQISQILSTDDPVTLFVTDGFTRVKAKLSESAVATLEAELGEKIDEDVKGDILIIREAIVKSTPHGPSDGFIQLAIESLEYLFHLRKPLGQPQPVEERADTVKLLEQIIELRRKSWPLLGQSREPTPYPLSVNRTPEASRSGGRTNGLNDAETPRSQRSVVISQHSSPVLHDSPSTQRALATQIPTRQRSSGPTLAKDGFEIQEGVNLSRPIGRGAAGTNADISPPSRGKSAPATNATVLLSLLGKRKPEPPAEAAHVAQAPPPPSFRASQKEPRANSAPTPNLESEPHLFVPNEPGSKQLTSPAERKGRDYRRRKVPRNQQKLLDNPSSWFPPAPGRQFPHPNVPIELLGRWNAQAASEAKMRPSKPSPVQADSHGVVSERADGNGIEMARSDTSSSASSSDDEEFTASQWPLSPAAQVKPLLPPDSSIGTNSRPSTADKHAGSPWKISNERFRAREGLSDTSPVAVSARVPVSKGKQASPIQHNPADVTAGSDAVSTRTPVPLPQRPDWIPYSSPRVSSSEPFSKQPFTTPNRSNSRPITSDGKLTGGVPLSSNATFAKPSPPAPRGPPDSVFGSVVKGTQFSKNGEDDLEMGVPRSLDQDPAIEHRKRRSEHFRAAQRREWIRNNYARYSSDLGFPSVYRAYKKAYPNDVIRLSDFALAIEEIYPPRDGSPSKDTALLSSSPADNVLSSSQVPPAAAADVHGAAATPPKLSNKQQVASAPSSSSRSSRVLPWTNVTRSTPRLSQGTGSSKAASTAVPASALRTSPTIAPYKTGLGSKMPLESPNNLRTKEINEHASTTQRHIAPSTPHTTANVSTSTNDSATSSRQLHRPAPQQAIIDLTVENSQSKLNTDSTVDLQNNKIEAQDDGMEIDEPRRNKVSVFAEFARAWTSLEPGGAFVPKVGERKEQKPLASRLDVLSWNL